jgi:hypothetical protein
LFFRANKVNPAIMGFGEKEISAFPARLAKGGLRLDRDEREHAIFLASEFESSLGGVEHPHVETIHIHKSTGDLDLIPTQFRKALIKIITQYTKGFTMLKNNSWVKGQNPIEEVL